MFPNLIEHAAEITAEGLLHAEPHGHLERWPELGTGLALSALILAAGGALFALRRPVEQLQERLDRAWSAQSLFHAGVRTARRASGRFTAIIQPGSLPFYLSVIMITVVLGPAIYLATGFPEIDGLVFAESWQQVALVGLVTAAALGVTLTQRRFAAAMQLGAVGYGVATLFVIQGAPDLALTQFIVETVAVAAFVLVLRQLPRRFRPARERVGIVPRIVISAAVGAFVFAMALAASTERTGEPPAAELAERSLPDAGGHNIVNVILVDFRALDTLGEATVVAVAALGVAALVQSARRAASESRP